MVSMDNWKYYRHMRAGLTLKISGTVQGVGFRPFVYRLASDLKLAGQIYNTTYGVCIELDGEEHSFVNFIDRLMREKPEHAAIKKFEKEGGAARGYTEFKIGESKSGSRIEAGLLPDIALCEDCRRELFDPADRRFLYPFINCTNCGPRFSIISALPYDRCNTSMKHFSMCPACMAEYHDPGNRRFHAQPNACPDCGPQVVLLSNKGAKVSAKADAIDQAVYIIQHGGSIAVKGIGGFHIMCRADSPDAIRRLREKKHRPAKPLALLFPDVQQVRECCLVSNAEQKLLLSAAHPIVLLRKKDTPSDRIHAAVAPDNPYLGVMLPYAPLQHVLMQKLGQPVIATSANLVDETICIADDEVFGRLGSVVDAVLSHDRPIVRHADDSIARVFQDEPIILRRARGFTGTLLQSESASAPTLVALGGQLKNTFSVNLTHGIYTSQYIGDLSSAVTNNVAKAALADFSHLYQVSAVHQVRDLHPDYMQANFSDTATLQISTVQHHLAHVASVYHEHRLQGTVLGVAWDGTGYGGDGTIWGGEFFQYNGSQGQHIAQLKQFPLPGGEAAIKEPRRSALGLIYACLGLDEAKKMGAGELGFSSHDLEIVLQLLQRKINSPMTSSAGRLFDAIAALLGLKQRVSFEGEAAMQLEFCAAEDEDSEYPFCIEQGPVSLIDLRKMLVAIIADKHAGLPTTVISARVHNTLSAIIAAVCRQCGSTAVALSGGCFQNELLLRRCVEKLWAAGCDVYWNKQIPTNDGGISFGQLAHVLCAMKETEKKEE